jgi:hypothetical protein
MNVAMNVLHRGRDQYRSTSLIRRIVTVISENISTVFELLTVGLGMVAFVWSTFFEVSVDALVPIVVAILASLAITTLLERVTKLAKLDRKVDDVVKKTAEIPERVVEAISSINSQVTLFRNSGITGGCETLDWHDLAKRMENAKSIRILSNWVGALSELGPTFVRAANRECEIQILVLQHNSEYAKQRSIELSHGTFPDFVQSQIASEIEQFAKLYRENPILKRYMTVKAYNICPVMCLFAYDDIRLLGLFWRGEYVMHSPFLELDGRTAQRSAVIQRIDKHFRMIWDDVNTRYIRWGDKKPEYVVYKKQAWSTSVAPHGSAVAKVPEAVYIARRPQLPLPPRA